MFARLLTCVILCLCLSSEWPLGSPLDSALYPSQENQLAGRKRGWVYGKLNTENKRVKRADSHVRGKAVAQILHVFTLLSPHLWVCCRALCPSSGQEKADGSSAHPGQGRQTAMDNENSILLSVFSENSRDINVNYQRISVSHLFTNSEPLCICSAQKTVYKQKHACPSPVGSVCVSSFIFNLMMCINAMSCQVFFPPVWFRSPLNLFQLSLIVCSFPIVPNRLFSYYEFSCVISFVSFPVYDA